MNAADNPHIEVLLSTSADDEHTFQLPVPDRIFGFHAQQAVEKLYKALITAHGQRYPFVHDLVKLAERLTDLGETLPALPMSLRTITDLPS